MKRLCAGVLACGCLLVSACNRGKPGEPVQAKWDGKSTLSCPPSPNGEKNSLTITDCKADLPMTAVELNHCDVTLVRCDIKSGDFAVSINNDCTLTLKDSTIHGRVGIDANNNSKVVIEGGSIQGEDVGLMIENRSTLRLHGATVRGSTGVLVRNGASAVLESGRVEGAKEALYVFNYDTKVSVKKDVTIAGRIVREGGGIVTGVPEIERAQANERVANKFGPRVCEMAFACYGDQLGQRAGRYSVEVGAEGRVLAATFKGEVAAPIHKCLLDTKGKSIKGYDASPGTLQCAYTANIGPTSRSLDRSWTFVPK
jgi:hypothetical protein